MGVVSGRKGKGKGVTKQKNKKEKVQEIPDSQLSPTIVSPEQENQEPHEGLHYQEQASPQVQHNVERNTLPLELSELPPLTTEDEADTALRPKTPNVAPSQLPVDDNQKDIEEPLSDQKELKASGLPEGNHDADRAHDLYVSGDQAEYPHPTSVAGAKTAIVSPVPASIPLPSPSLSEIQYTTSHTRSRTSSPAALNYASPPLTAASPASRHASPTAKFGSPASRIYHPIPKAASPAPSTISPILKVSSPLVPSFMPPMMSPSTTPPVAPAIPSAHPLAAPSAVPAYHSPVMSSVGGVPAYAPHRYPPVPTMFPIPHTYVDSTYASSLQAIQDVSLNGGHRLDKGVTSPPENEQELVDLLQRIQSAIPDINRLMHGFRHAQAKLSSREAEFKHAVKQHAQTLMRKEYYINALESQMKKAARESAEESTKLKDTVSKLRMELGSLQEKERDLEENLAMSGKLNKELSQSKADLEDQITRLNTSIQEAQESHERELDRLKEEQAEALASQKQELTELFEEIKNEDERTAAEVLEAREKELLGQQELLKADHEKEKQQMQESHDALQSKFDEKQDELAAIREELGAKVAELESKQAELDSLRDEVAAKISELEERQKELDDARAEHEITLSELRQGHANEMQSLQTHHEEELFSSARVLADKLTALKTYGEKEQQWAEEKSELENRLCQKIEELSNSEREKESVQEDGIFKEQQLQRAVEEMQATINGLGSESDRLRKTLNSLGEATDLKNTKTDSFL